MGTIGVKINQLISFSSFRMKTSKARSVFFPGCALMKFDNNILKKIYNFLKEYDNECGLSLMCCSAPSYVLSKKHLENKQKVIAEKLRLNGVKKIYVACPNCKEKLDIIKNKYNLDYETIFIYDVIANNLDKIKKYYPIDEEFMIQDPCRVRREKNTMDNIRIILDRINQKYVEPKSTKENTICCGNINMLHVTAPEKSRKLCELRDKQFMGKNIITYCNGCILAFSKLGTKGVHILELVFGKSKKMSVLNRIKFVMENQKC